MPTSEAPPSPGPIEGRVFRRVAFSASVGSVTCALAIILKWPQYDTGAWFFLGSGVGTLVAIATWRHNADQP